MAAESDAELKHSPYIPNATRLPEFTFRAVLTGALLGIIFGASSLYLALKVGLTVSASIPVAVISITLFRILAGMGARDASILENNIAQTAGSAGESIAFGVAVTMPAILVLGFDLEITRVMLVATLGGLLGILLMIPLRRALIVHQHHELKYPEGTACAEVLKAGASEESVAAADPLYKTSRLSSGVNAKTIFGGFALGLVYKLGNSAFRLWKEVPEKVFGAPLKGGSLSCEISPEMLGVGYIIGPRIAGFMAGGGVLSYLVLVPMIKFFGSGLGQSLSPDRTGKLIGDMSPGNIRNAYILYIGAGAVAAGGLISLIRALPTIWRSLRLGLSDLAGSRAELAAGTVRPRTERDLSMRFVLGGIFVLLVAITAAPDLHMKLLGAILILLLGFFFVTVSSRLTGEVGSSSNPISGMTIATLLLTCVTFVAVGWTGSTYYVTALSIGGIVCIACSNGGTTSQDLKTGFLIGGTPKYQQIAILIGSFASALVMGYVLLLMNQSGTVYVKAQDVSPGLVAPREVLAGAKHEKLRGSQAESDSQEYLVWRQADPGGGNPRKWLVDSEGKAVWLVDPAITGTYKTLPSGASVTKYDAPKTVLVSYIIKGVLDRRLPWDLVLIGAMIAVFLELSGVPSLAFAVGVYLPLSTSLGIFAGGMVRWLVDHYDRKKHVAAGRTEVEIAAESDRSPGVLMASGYIAGGSIAGIGVAITQGLFSKFDEKLEKIMTASNAFYDGAWSDLLSLIPFAVLIALLFLAARERFLGPTVSRREL
ncbi:MAG TPA: oligopeptide transporter, OPT family [Candidatus Limnocylindria bacterium]|jgi:putative OPT family oligopeptide transporter|nr:oligopeptide transporter, OPT family [Candidatus Limnocylindria bacterium]